jgi:hypothetical protein
MWSNFGASETETPTTRARYRTPRGRHGRVNRVLPPPRSRVRTHINDSTSPDRDLRAGVSNFLHTRSPAWIHSPTPQPPLPNPRPNHPPTLAPSLPSRMRRCNSGGDVGLGGGELSGNTHPVGSLPSPAPPKQLAMTKAGPTGGKGGKGGNGSPRTQRIKAANSPKEAEPSSPLSFPEANSTCHTHAVDEKMEGGGGDDEGKRGASGGAALRRFDAVFGPGPLGLALEQCGKGGTQVKHCAGGGAAEKLGTISPGDRLLTVAGRMRRDVSSMSVDEVMEVIGGSSRPMTLGFETTGAAGGAGEAEGGERRPSRQVIRDGIREEGRRMSLVGVDGAKAVAKGSAAAFTSSLMLGKQTHALEVRELKKRKRGRGGGGGGGVFTCVRRPVCAEAATVVAVAVCCCVVSILSACRVCSPAAMQVVAAACVGRTMPVAARAGVALPVSPACLPACLPARVPPSFLAWLAYIITASNSPRCPLVAPPTSHDTPPHCCSRPLPPPHITNTIPPRLTPLPNTAPHRSNTTPTHSYTSIPLCLRLCSPPRCSKRAAG